MATDASYVAVLASVLAVPLTGHADFGGWAAAHMVLTALLAPPPAAASEGAAPEWSSVH